LTLEGGEWSFLCCSHFIPREKANWKCKLYASWDIR